MIYILLILGTLLFVLLLWPLLTPQRATAADTLRTELHEEQELLLRNLEDLQVSGADPALVTREKVRLAQVLSELDALPAAPPTPEVARSALPVGLALLLGVVALMVLGSFTFLNNWRYSALAPVEVSQLQNSARLPTLERTATASNKVTDLAAWGNAAWEAQNYAVAAKAYTQVLLQDRTDATALRRVGFYLLTTEEMAQDGLGFIQRSVDADPKAPEGQLLYGYALGLFGRFDDALKVLKNYQTLAPESREADDLIVEFQQRSGVQVDGALLYAQNCAACHGDSGEGKTGPKLAGSSALINEAALRQQILNGGMTMPAFPQLDGQPMDALIKHLKGL